MTINKLVRKEYPVTEAYTSVYSIKSLLLRHPAVVVMDEEKALGILTSKDIAQNAYNLIADYVRHKPAVTPNDEISAVSLLMEETFSDALLVYDQAGIYGIICKDDILKYYRRTSEYNQRLLHGIAHDLKNPISSIYTINNMLGENIQKEENKELLAYSRKSVDYALELLDDFLEAEQLPEQVPEITAIDVNELLKLCLAQDAMAGAEKQIKLISYFNAFPSRILGNRLQLQRAFNNLIINAIKFTNVAGTIKVSTIIEKDQLLISIQDSGIGIPEHLKPVLFDKFTSAARQGTNGENTTGLGLYITRIIIEEHKGKIWIESTEGVGSTIYVTLPLINDNKISLTEI